MQRKIRIERPGNCRFDERKADRTIRFFSECLHHTKGRYAGRPFVPLPFQAIDLREVFGRVDEDGNRIIRTVYEAIPKKNGKSEVAAGVAGKLLFADDEPGAEIYGAASDRGQASIVFNVLASMVRRNRELAQISKIIDTTKRIVVPEWESFYCAISSEVASKHGYNTHGVVFDEVHAQKNRRLWEVLTFGAGAARSQPLTWAITTAGIPGESPVAEDLHEQADQILRGIIPCPPDFYPIIYEAPEDWPWDSEETWRYCNPAMGTLDEIKAGKAFLSIEAVRHDEYAKALRSSSDKQSFLRLRLNRWVAQAVRWIDMDQWDRGGTFTDIKSYEQWRTNEIRELRHLPCYAGLDLATKLDITAFVLVWLDGAGGIHLIPWFWLPGDTLQDRPNVEMSKYREWIGAGLMTATHGSAVDFDVVRNRINEIGQAVNVSRIAFDPKFAHQLAQQLTGDGFTMAEFRQGYNSYTPPCVEFESALADGNVFHGGNPVLRWMADCVTVKPRGDGAMMPVKTDRLKSSKRIDGIVAALMGLNNAITTEDTTIPYTGLRVVG